MSIRSMKQSRYGQLQALLCIFLILFPSCARKQVDSLDENRAASSQQPAHEMDLEGFIHGILRISHEKSQWTEEDSFNRDPMVRSLRARLAENPRDLKAVRELADLAFETGYLEQALADYQTLHEMSATDWQLELRLAALYEALELFPEAMKHSGYSLLLKPDSVDALRVLVSSHLGLGNLDEARAVLHKVLTLEPENSWASDRLDEIGGHFTGTRVLELERWFISPATEALLTEWPSEPTGPQIVAVTLSDPPDADPAEKPESRTGLDSEYLPPPVMVTLGPQKSTVFPRDLTVIGDSTVRSQDSDRDMLVETALLTLGASPKGDRKNPEKILESIELISLSLSVEVHGIPLSKSVPVFEPPPDRPVSEKPVVTAAGEVTSDPNEDELGLPAETTPRKLAERPRQNVLVSQAISVIPSFDDLGLGSGWEDQLSLVDTLPSSAENMIHVSGLASSSSLVVLPVSDDQLNRTNESGMIQKAELIGSPTFIGGLVCAVVVVSVFGLLAGMGTMTLLGGLLAAAAVFVLVCWCAGSGTDVEPADIRRGRI